MRAAKSFSFFLVAALGAFASGVYFATSRNALSDDFKTLIAWIGTLEATGGSCGSSPSSA